ncbi:glycosyltransferase family 39 protein [Gemmatimonas aurantiaca]|nr:glycosyltransferase family 39 protein [Gemmatimonas aurantiaca]
MIQQFKTFTNKEKARLFWLVAFAAIYRALYLYLYSKQSIWSELVVDSLFHINWADQIAAGDAIGSETFFRSPLYIYVLAGLRALTPDSLLLPRIYGAFLGLASISLTYLLTRTCISGKLGERAALAAGALQALYPSMLFFETELLVDFQFIVLLQGALYLFLLAPQADASRIKLYLGCGVLLGLAALTRATALALVPLFLWHIWRDHSSAEDSQKVFRYIFGFLVALALTIAPVTLRNYYVSDDLTLIASSGGINLFIGNHAVADPVSASLPQPLGSQWTIADMRGAAERFEGHSLTDSEVSASWRNRALDWILENPLDFARHYAHKLYLLLSNQPYSNNRPLESVFHNNPLLRYSPLNFALLFLLTSLGFFAMKTEYKAFRRLLRFALCYGLVVALFFVNERFRLPSLAILFPSAGLGLVSMLALLNSTFPLADKKWRNDSLTFFTLTTPRVTLLIVVSLISLVVTLVPFGRPQENTAARALYLSANHKLRTGDLSAARALYSGTLKHDPTYPRANLNLGVTFFKIAQEDSSRTYFERELELYPRQSDALTNLASLELSAGNITAADEHSQIAYSARPYDLTTVRVRLRILAELQQILEIEKVARDTRERFADDPRYWLELGVTLIKSNDFAGAKEMLSHGAQLDPYKFRGIEASDGGYGNAQGASSELVRAAANIQYRLGFLAGVSGDLNSVILHSQRAIQLHPNLISAYVNLGLAYYSLGQVESAHNVYQNALRISGASGQQSFAELDRLAAVLQLK